MLFARLYERNQHRGRLLSALRQHQGLQPLLTARYLPLTSYEKKGPRNSVATYNVQKLFLAPIATRASALVGSILGLPPEHPKTRLCIFSIAGQVIFHVLSSTALGKLAGRPPITEAECEVLADHITEFSLAYLHQHRNLSGKVDT